MSCSHMKEHPEEIFCAVCDKCRRCCDCLITGEYYET